MALLRHLGENPGSPERALMAHLRDCRGAGPAQGSGPTRGSGPAPPA
jgi:hypothetical protein